MSKFGDDIRRIVGLDKENKPLDPAEQKKSLDGLRGISYLVGGSVQAATGTPGVTTRSNTEKKAADALSDAAEELFESSGDTLPEDDALLQGALDGAHDIVCLLDGTCGPELSEVGDPAAGALNEINGIAEHVGGVAMKIRLDGNYRVPADWTEQNNPPSDGTWTLGSYWFIDSSGLVGVDCFGDSFDTMIDNVIAAGASSGAIVIPRQVDVGPTYTDMGPAVAEGRIRLWLNYIGGSSAIYEYNTDYMIRTCGDAEAIGAGFECSTTAPTSARWGTTGFFIMSQQLDGIFRSNVYDSEVPNYLKGDQSTLRFTFDNGTRNGKIVPNKLGGKMIVETIDDTPIGLIRVYRPNRTLAAVVEAADYDKWVPR